MRQRTEPCCKACGFKLTAGILGFNPEELKGWREDGLCSHCRLPNWRPNKPLTKNPCDAFLPCIDYSKPEVCARCGWRECRHEPTVAPVIPPKPKRRPPLPWLEAWREWWKIRDHPTADLEHAMGFGVSTGSRGIGAIMEAIEDMVRSGFAAGVKWGQDHPDPPKMCGNHPEYQEVGCPKCNALWPNALWPSQQAPS